MTVGGLKKRIRDEHESAVEQELLYWFRVECPLVQLDLAVGVQLGESGHVPGAEHLATAAVGEHTRVAEQLVDGFAAGGAERYGQGDQSALGAFLEQAPERRVGELERVLDFAEVKSGARRVEIGVRLGPCITHFCVAAVSLITSWR